MKKSNHLVTRIVKGIVTASFVFVSAFSAVVPSGVAHADSQTAPPAAQTAYRKVYIAHVNITAWAARTMHRKFLPHGEWYIDMGRRMRWHGMRLALINTDYGLCWIGAAFIGL